MCVCVCVFVSKSSINHTGKGPTDFILYLYNLIYKVHQLMDFSGPMRVLHVMLVHTCSCYMYKGVLFVRVQNGERLHFRLS